MLVREREGGLPANSVIAACVGEYVSEREGGREGGLPANSVIAACVVNSVSSTRSRSPSVK